jgi:hypothetical protein
VDEIEMKGENRDDPSVDASARGDVRIGEHTLDISGINFNDEISNTNKIETKGTKGAIEAVDFELGLGVLRFSIIERNGTEATVIPLARIFNIALTEMESNCKVRRVNCENNWSRRSIVDGAKCGRRE